MSRFATGLRLATFVVLGSVTTSFGQSISAVEEEWELIVGVPNSSRSSPQLNCLMSPFAHSNSVYAIFDINNRSVSRKGGGLQVQIWDGDTLLAVGNFSNAASLAREGEKLQWTQRMSVSDGILTFEIIGGTSQTWGKFGGQGELIAAATTGIANLNGYDPNVSAENSGVDFGQQRVEKMTLRKVRTYTNGKKSIERALDRVVFQQ